MMIVDHRNVVALKFSFILKMYLPPGVKNVAFTISSYVIQVLEVLKWAQTSQINLQKQTQ